MTDPLPPPGTGRWTPNRKAAVVQAIEVRRLSLSQACDRYGLSPGELATWQQLYWRHGVPGLRSTRLRIYRRAKPDARR
jgi:transposase-like protein